jgi:hypothetical protein
MSEQILTRATYRSGHSILGRHNIAVWLVDGPHDFILRQRSDGRAVLAIPKAGLRRAMPSSLLKEGLASHLALLMHMVPLLDISSKADYYYSGVDIAYTDIEIGRDEFIFLDTTTQGKARRIAEQLWELQATYMRSRMRLGQLMR